jgi:hypothetical protein
MSAAERDTTWSWVDSIAKGAARRQLASAAQVPHNSTNSGGDAGTVDAVSRKRSLLYSSMPDLQVADPAPQPNDADSQVESEIARYKAERAIGLGDDPLHWWKMNDARYPHLAVVAKAVLGTPASSVPSESLFSIAGYWFGVRRARIRGDHLEQQLIVKRMSTFVREFGVPLAAPDAESLE